jgi:hypothetical protein
MNVEIDITRIPETLFSGSHEDHEAMCVMEAVAYVAGEAWSDQPRCASPVATLLAVGLNDAIGDDAWRTELLKPLVPKLIGTRDGKDLQRSYLALDWLVRVYLPTWCDLVPALKVRAVALRDLPPIAGADTFGIGVQALLQDSRKDAHAAGAAAGDAAWAAAGDAAGDALKPTVKFLQASAADLLRRMCEV